MAYVVKRGNSYRIEFFEGRDKNSGKKGKRTVITWKPQVGLTPAKEKKALEAFIRELENKRQGGIDISQNRQTFEEYADYVLTLKEKKLKPKTIADYRVLLPRINAAIGHLAIKDINARHLNNFYMNLQEDGIKRTQTTASAKPTLAEMVKKKQYSHSEIARLAGISDTTVWSALHGKSIRGTNAAAIASAMGIQTNRLFTLSHTSAKLSNNTVLHYHRFISMVFQQAVKESLIDINPAAKTEKPSLTKSAPNYLQPDELADVLQKLDCLDETQMVWRVYFNVMAVTGCRRSELCGLHWSNISLQMGRIKIERALVYIPQKGLIEGSTKTEDVRFLNIPPETVELLKSWQAVQNSHHRKIGQAWNGTTDTEPMGTDYVFTNSFGKPLHPDSVSKWMRDFSLKHLDKIITPHSFRHSAASILIASGFDVVTVSKQLGHSDPTTTQKIYAHLIEEQQANVSDCIANAILRSAKNKSIKQA